MGEGPETQDLLPQGQGYRRGPRYPHTCVGVRMCSPGHSPSYTHVTSYMAHIWTLSPHEHGSTRGPGDTLGHGVHPHAVTHTGPAHRSPCGAQLHARVTPPTAPHIGTAVYPDTARHQSSAPHRHSPASGHSPRADMDTMEPGSTCNRKQPEWGTAETHTHTQPHPQHSHVEPHLANSPACTWSSHQCSRLPRHRRKPHQTLPSRGQPPPECSRRQAWAQAGATPFDHTG